MADQNLSMKQSVTPNLIHRTVLVGRVKMANAISLPEGEWAKMISDIEKDPLFQELLDARSEGRRIIKFKRFSHTGLASQFYDMQELNVAGGSGQTPEAMLEHKQHLLALIKKIGQDNFEKFFLYRDTKENTEQIAGNCGITKEEARQLEDFMLDMSVQSEFYHPSSLTSEAVARPNMIGKIIKNEDETYSISFFSPLLARGLYEIDRNALRLWQKSKKLDRDSSSRLRKYVGMLELANMKQGAFWRVIDLLLKVQKPYLDSRDPAKLAPLSLRKIAKQLQFAPSTISRVFSLKSVLLPWDREILLLSLMPGQRRVVLEILEKILSDGQTHLTDNELSRKIAEEHGVKVSRRTITACRHVLNQNQKKAA